jgi:hypothetical protein
MDVTKSRIYVCCAIIALSISILEAVCTYDLHCTVEIASYGVATINVRHEHIKC